MIFNGKPRFFAAVCAVVALAVLLVSLVGCQTDKPNEVNSPADVKGRTIGSIEGSPSVVLAEELGVSKPFATGEELMYNLKEGTLDCVIMEKSAAVDLASATTGVRVLSEPILKYDLRFAVARENAELLNAVNTALAALTENGTVKGLIGKYFSAKKYVYKPPEGVVMRPGYLSLAVPSDYPPYSYKDKNGVLTGLDIEVAQAVCDYLGVELRITEYDARELVTAVWYGRADLALGWIPTEGESVIAESDPYADSAQVIIVRR